MDHSGCKKQDNYEPTLDANARKHPRDHESGQDARSHSSFALFASSLIPLGKTPPFSFVLIRSKPIKPKGSSSTWLRNHMCNIFVSKDTALAYCGYPRTCRRMH